MDYQAFWPNELPQGQVKNGTHEKATRLETPRGALRSQQDPARSPLASPSLRAFAKEATARVAAHLPADGLAVVRRKERAHQGARLVQADRAGHGGAH